jgi:hypothetical protein
MVTRLMTHPLGPGTRNFPVNWPADELATLGRLACERGTSLGGLIKHLVREGLAAETRRAAGAAALLALFLGITAIQWPGHETQDIRRVKASVRVRRSEA